MSLIRLIARPMLATSFVASGVARLKNSSTTGEQLRPTLERIESLVPSINGLASQEATVAKVVGGTQVGAGALLAIGKFPRLSSALLALTAILTSIAEFKNADASTKEGRANRLSALLKNISLIGGVLVAAVDRNGKPSLAWRAEHLAKDSKKNFTKTGDNLSKKAERLAKKAQKEVKAARKNVKNSAQDALHAAGFDKA